MGGIGCFSPVRKTVVFHRVSGLLFECLHRCGKDSTNDEYRKSEIIRDMCGSSIYLDP